MFESTCLPDDKDALREMVIALQAQSDALQIQYASFEKALKNKQARISALDQYITTLEQQLAVLRRARCGRSSEHCGYC